ncbi:hypothetical protein N0V95_007979 [Ascochyta clinopodiicola]|nr:hypothetical protein N0V95_007979 [Ascochyta clinopodiicola]
MPRTLLLFGSGPGIGNNIAATFASRGPIDHVVLLSRNLQRLQNEDAPFVRNAAPNVKVDTLRADLSDLAALPSVLAQLDELTRASAVEVVYYNAARIKPTDPVLSVDIDEIEEDFRLISLSLVKGAQRTQVLSLNRAFSDAGVHCALVTVEGQVSPDNKVLSPKNIAAEAFGLWQRGEGVEVNLKEPGQ